MVNIIGAKAGKDINDFIILKLNSLQVLPISLEKLALILVDNYFDNSQNIAIYLTILCRPQKMDLKEFNIFKKQIIKFEIQDNYLFY